jgi:hypothetical protein
MNILIATPEPVLPEMTGGMQRSGNADDWVSAVKRLWHDDSYYSVLSAAARSYSERPSLNKDRQLGMWEDVLSGAVEHGRSCIDSSSLMAYPSAELSFSH